MRELKFLLFADLIESLLVWVNDQLVSLPDSEQPIRGPFRGVERRGAMDCCSCLASTDFAKTLLDVQFRDLVE